MTLALRMFAAVWLALASTAFAAAPDPSSAFNPAWAIVVPAEGALALTHQCSRAVPKPVQSTWTPTPAQIAELEEALFPALTVELVQRELNDKGWQAGDYYRQYGGLVVQGQRIIYVNGVHRSVVEHSGKPDIWKTQPIGICDGGELAFGAEYDPETKTVTKLQFNGKV